MTEDLGSIRRTRVQIIRRMSMETYMVRIYPGSLNYTCEFTAVEAEKVTSAAEIVEVACSKLKIPNPENYELAEVLSSAGQLCKERRLEPSENPVKIQLLWPKIVNAEMERYRFYLRVKDLDNLNRTSSWKEYKDSNTVDTFLTSFLQQPTTHKEYSDLCNLPDLNELTLLENVKSRFQNSNIYTYVGSILIAVNPFKFFPIYNPKYVKMYQNKRLGELPPHIFAIADSAFYTMLRTKKNQCIVISGESGSGKTESTNLLIHHLTALSQKGSHGSGVEQTILGAGPVLEAFGNAKTVHNNNSSRFGKFIQVNYKENGMVHGAIVEKYLLEKSRIVSQARSERNYHVFYYLLAGADHHERDFLHLEKPEDYYYLKQSNCYTLEGEDEVHEFARLKQSMEMVGFSPITQRRIFSVLSAVLQLGNVEFRKKGDQHHDESVSVLNESAIKIISSLLKVKEKTVLEALTQKRTTAGGETVVINYRMEDAVATRDGFAKCLYGSLFDWIVLKVNQALLTKRHNSDHQGNSIGVLDIFGFEDFTKNSFEQFCINYANEHLQYYFNQHIFKFEQEEYKKEGIQWKNIEFIDNTKCLELFSKKPKGLFCLLDEECNFPGATNETLLSKFNHHHKNNTYYEVPQLKQGAFVVMHYAGKVKYQCTDFREKNSDQIKQDILSVLKSSSLTFVKELMGVDPVAVLRWSIVRTLVRSVFAFKCAGKKYRENGGVRSCVISKNRKNSDFVTLPESLSASENLLNYGVEAEWYLYLLDTGDYQFRKNKSFRPKPKPPTMLRDIKTLKDIASRTMFGGGKLGSKKQPPSVSAQFQWSLSKLMSTLNQANPFFIRCIKSNPSKAACEFDDVLVLRQLRYTGMLATVKIRQSGYNYRLKFEEFIQLYKILLPKALLSSKDDVKEFLQNMDLNVDNYQIGTTKVFLRESEKIKLDEALHGAIMKRVVTVQRWFKSILERRYFVKLRSSSIVLQSVVRCFLARRNLRKTLNAVIMIQKFFRGYKDRRDFLVTFHSTVVIQSAFRGHKCRQLYKLMKAEAEERRRLEAEEKARQKLEDLQSSNSDEGILRGSSAEELDEKDYHPVNRRDSEASSGVHEFESEPDTLSVDRESLDTSITTPPNTPEPSILIHPTITDRDDYLRDSRSSSSRVHEMAKAFQDKAVEPSSPSPSEVSTGSLLTPDKLAQIEECLKKPPTIEDKSDHVTSSLTDPNQAHKSPFYKAKRHFKNIMGDLRHSQSCNPTTHILRHKSSFRLFRDRSTKKVKKESQGDESDDESEVTRPKRRPQDWPLIQADLAQHVIGINVLPPLPASQMSPRTPSDKEGFPEELSQSSENLKENERKARKKQRRQRKQPVQEPKSTSPPRGNWAVSGTSQWQYPADLIITDLDELFKLDHFILQKCREYNKNDGKRDTIFDCVFKKSLKEFQKDMKAIIALELQRDTINVPYRNLLGKFVSSLEAEVTQEGTDASFPVTMGVNAFRGYLDEFIKNHRKPDKKEEKKVNHREKHKREKQKKDVFEFLGHKFTQVQFGIPTFCELCSNIMWIMEKGSVCQVCKYTCHKRCVNKSTNTCKGVQDAQNNSGSRVFGAPLASLVTEKEKIPSVVGKLIDAIETHGLYTVGVYRKAGANAKMKLLKQNIDSGKEDLSSIDLFEYPIHVLTQVLKGFLRDLPEPLLTYELYDDFIRTTEIHDEKERVQSIYAVIDKLPKPNHDLLERLVFHLARVAMHEHSNKMSANGLAIVFAPCLLRTNKKLQAQESLNQVPKLTVVVEHIIKEQVMRIKTTLADISTLESAEVTAADRLNIVRASMRASKSPTPADRTPAQPVQEVEETTENEVNPEEEERALCSHIISIKKEKENLTSKLPALECRHLSSDDEIISTDEMDSMYDTADDGELSEEYALTFELPGGHFRF
ncbi:hypothetical protein KUTeg_017857 [Tegillarca granosa]|uniref:Unconventional myosin-IXb n=1 Tax=Tegillarca granosa TaxID=220873 RepID=A0ABQ9EHP9_TEGGR|nr:hypothetical protein KUTeg_017857 [Tegillarca granosa]